MRKDISENIKNRKELERQKREIEVVRDQLSRELAETRGRLDRQLSLPLRDVDRAVRECFAVNDEDAFIRAV